MPALQKCALALIDCEQLWKEESQAHHRQSLWPITGKRISREHYSTWCVLTQYHAVLTSQIERPEDNIQLTHLYRAFTEWWQRGPGGGRDVRSALQAMRNYATFYERIFSGSDTDRVALFGRRIRTLDVSTVLPLVLFLGVERADETSSDLDGILSDLESYLVRRMICALPTSSYNRTFVKLMTDLRRSGVVTRQAVQEHLLALTGPTAEWPTDAQFRERWLNRDSYWVLTAGRIVLVLEGIEWALYGHAPDRARPASGFVYTIEHIMPQTTTRQDWPLDVPAGATTEFIAHAEVQRTIRKQTLGNLTLLAGPLNASLSNGSFEGKREAISNRSTLMLNRYFTQHNITTWDAAAIITRGDRLFEIARSVWPRP